MNEIICALSFALDLTEGAVPGHAIRSCLYGMQIADELRLSHSEREALYYALLLKDIGCSSNSARMCMLTGGDDRLIKRDVKFLDWTRPSVQAVATLWNHALPDASAVERIKRIVRLGLDQQRNNEDMIQLRCDRGASIARKIGLSEDTAEAIRLLDEHWDGSGFPGRLRGHQIPILARIIAVAQHLDVFTSEYGLARAVDELDARSGRWFDPELVCLVTRLHSQGALAQGFRPGNDSRARVMDLEPEAPEALAPESVDTICEAFADVVDAKSSFTYTHSVGVTRAAIGIAGELGFDAERIRMIYRASLLHDLGKLSVPNTILDKPGRLTDEEWIVVRGHAELSEQILARITHFGVLAKMAGQHHEKLDGSGYPYGLTAKELTLDSRVIALADVFGALSEDRPYRRSLKLEQVLSILKKDVPRKLDPDCFEALVRFLEKGGHPTPIAA
jgi:HD-GYP domain-containing protein (c-di-GMP phosphodiesterase class II)